MYTIYIKYINLFLISATTTNKPAYWLYYDKIKQRIEENPILSSSLS